MDNEDIKNKSASKPGFNEPIIIYNSFEEAENAHNKRLASLTQEQHLQNALQLIKRLYKEDLILHPNIGTDFKID